MSIVLHVTYSQFIIEPSVSIANVNIEMLYMKELSMSVLSVTIELLRRIFFLNLKEINFSL